MIRKHIRFLELQGMVEREVHHCWRDSACDQGQKEAAESYQSGKFLPKEYLNERGGEGQFLALNDRGRCENNLGLSDVLNLFWIVSHPKKLHLGGAETFQISVLKLVVVDPKNLAL